jgi:hypothetical protein
MKNPNDSSSDEELVFNTLGSSINDAFLDIEDEEDVDDVEFDSMDDRYEN